MLKKIAVSGAFGLALVLAPLATSTAHAGQLPPLCTKLHGTVTCTTTLGPGKNQGGVGTTLTTYTQGNLTNNNPNDLPPPSSLCSPPNSQKWCPS